MEYRILSLPKAKFETSPNCGYLQTSTDALSGGVQDFVSNKDKILEWSKLTALTLSQTTNFSLPKSKSLQMTIVNCNENGRKLS